MRDEVLNYLNSLTSDNYKVSAELPFGNSGVQMFQKNPKRLYVDKDQVEVETFMPVLNGTIDAETRTVRVFFSNDSKQLPADYEAVLAVVKAAKDAAKLPEHFRTECSVSTEHEGDLMVTTTELRFTKLLS